MVVSVLRIVLTAVCIPLLLFLSTAPKTAVQGVPFVGAISTYEQHVLAAFVLTLLLWWWMAKRLGPWAGPGAFGVVMAVAAVLEVVQLFLPHRGGRITDLYPAIWGSSLALVAGYTTKRLRRRL